jgi:hypothetical protein
MTKNRKNVLFDGSRHWFSLPYAASVSRLSKPEIIRRALAGEFEFQEDKFGKPIWIISSPILELQKAAQKLETEKRLKQKDAKPRQKTASQLEAHWARLSQSNAKEPRDSCLTAHRIRATIGNIKIKKMDD